MADITFKEANRVRRQKGRRPLSRKSYKYACSRGLPVTIWTPGGTGALTKKRRRRSRRRMHRYRTR